MVDESAFVLFTANMRDLTDFRHKFDDSRRIYCLESYLISSVFKIMHAMIDVQYLVRLKQFLAMPLLGL